ncbi:MULTISPECIES: hypothetical protein [Oceanobacillus]|nr:MULTISPECIES: hypothetical protein [Oceanobacillus]MCT1576520.1 hypothetical protein [Oceanobacillus kimchii]MCT2136156.1 hypothetical protein [Oceanobacillus kimchii]
MNNDKEENTSPSEMKAEDLADVPALQDEFTREFIQSIEPVREGFYPFFSKSKSFTMDFPEKMLIDEKSHIVGPDNRSETLVIGYREAINDIFISHTFNYFNAISSPDSSKKQLSQSADYDLEFKNIDSNSKTYDVAEYKINDKRVMLVSLLWNDNQQIQITSTVKCTNELNDNNCEVKINNHKNSIIEQFKSIKFEDYKSE